MNKMHLNLLAATISALLLSACGDAETTIVQQDSIESGDDHDHDDEHDHGDGYEIESAGRLAVLSADANQTYIYDLDDNSLLDNFALTYASSSLSSSAGFRYAVINSRGQDQIEFIDGGLWQEDHGEHLHGYKQDPALTTYKLNGSRPTHLVKHDGKLAVFYDGNSETGENSSVQVLSDSGIANETETLAELTYGFSMHGVAEPNGEHLIATIRRDDSLSTSANKVLPDQVGLYHLHDGEYEQEHVFELTCPDLHGAAQNEAYQAFGCSDGVLITQFNENDPSSAKVANIDVLDGVRVGTLYGHHDVNNFIGIASSHGGGAAIVLNIDPVGNSMEEIDWQPVTGAQPTAYSFSADGEHFLILDNQGYLTLLSAHNHDGEQHWEFEKQIDISEEDVADMPEDLSFKMSISQNEPLVYIADPISKHILTIDIETAETVSDIELNYMPASVTWLGIKEDEHEHEEDHDEDHDHDH
ncbi:5-methyltetrahydrofolate--homocysteine methyltransferase [Catenovulum adriaticum]|uniref:5-methyltetrahydrofolate--homocysteine methyltransferase n=1 Tax=Catenovulum adriaticum TaxID=2984846 RepID=A0ABY7ATK2_9ALTE|nr:5-methyltetrahydrofolate--homocysteine methyltransferase [Catenovulum sp. TS8]WAJ72441.1 5-methyltetrahydrofolate--homocysteine methyltransferase [Catenovulum sp. TS8]